MSDAQIIDGKTIAKNLREEIALQIAAHSIKPHLAVVLAGDDEASLIYDRNKQKAALAMGMDCEIFHLPDTTSEAELLALVDKLNEDKKVNGIIVQLPLPRHINQLSVLSRIKPEKDVDGFSPVNAGLLQEKSPNAIVAATPKGILYLLQKVCGSLSGKKAVVIGRSNIVGRPLAALLLNHDCTVTVVHSKTPDIAHETRQADIVIAACGCPKLVKADWIKDGAVLIDVGINRIDGKLCGDIDFDDVKSKASYITPVPGGVGPMTIAMLLSNTYDAFLQQNNLKK